jgi:hypothetical protein
MRSRGDALIDDVQVMTRLMPKPAKNAGNDDPLP